jgi:uncharacterized protein YdeI (YjbR/CyaY-like superfamily)
MKKHTDGLQMYCPKNVQAWRGWLEKYHAEKRSVWLIYVKFKDGTRSISYEQAVEEALCFGWIDSKSKKLDETKTLQYFAKRNPKSNWSKLNKERVKKLIRENRMQAPGLEVIRTAKKNGTWDALNDVERLVVPDDLDLALKRRKKAYDNFVAFPDSSKRMILEWIQNARKPETRLKRVEETASLAAQNIRANHAAQAKKS